MANGDSHPTPIAVFLSFTFDFPLRIMASIKNRTVLYLTSIYLLSGMVVLGKPLQQRSLPSCAPGFSSDDPFDWNNSEPVGFSDGVTDGSGLIKARERGLFKFHKVTSSSSTSFAITYVANYSWS